MDNRVFTEEIRSGVAKVLSNKIVEVREVEKPNGVIYTGISIRTEGCNIAPTIYLDEDRSVEENVQRVLETYAQCQPKQELDMEWFTDYEQVKEKLSIMLTSKPISGLATRKAPGFDDLYMHAYVLLKNPVLGAGNVKVTKEHMKKWGVSNAKLFADALKSAQNITPANSMSMASMLGMLGQEEEMLEPMRVLSNKDTVMGAATILYTKVKENTYMIPSSIHEVILLDGEVVDPRELNVIINAVNREAVAPEEYLSNHAYRFNGKKWENVA